MQIEEIQATDVRKEFAEMLNRVAFLNAQYRIYRHNKKVARLVPETLMEAIEAMLKDDDRLAATLEKMLNDNLYGEVKEGMNILTLERRD